MTDTEIKVQGLKLLTEGLGSVEAERFIALILRERFDYTQWRQDLYEEFPIDEISRKAMRSQRTEEQNKRMESNG